MRERLGSAWSQIVAVLGSFMRLKKNRPRARAAIRDAQKELRLVLHRWEIAYHKELFIAAFAFSWSCNGMAPRSVGRWAG
jgi:hypothetical protein